MARYDIEDFLIGLKDELQAGLNTRISAIEAEKVAKGHPAETPTIPSAAYYEQTWDNAILNHKAAIFYGVLDIAALQGAPETAELYTVFIEAILTDPNNDGLAIARLHRITRAIRETLEAVMLNGPGEKSKIKIETVVPISFKLEEDSTVETRAGGVHIKIALA